MLRLLKQVGRSFEEEKVVEEDEIPEPPIEIPEGYFRELDAELDKWRDKVSNARATTLAQRAQFSSQQAELRRQLKAASDKLTHRRDTLVVTTGLTEYNSATKEVRDFIVPGVVAALQSKLCLHVHSMCVHQEQIRVAKEDHQEIIWWFEDMVNTLREEQADKEMELMNELVTLKVEVSTLIDEHSVKHSTHALKEHSVQELARRASVGPVMIRGGSRRSILMGHDKTALARRRSTFRTISAPGMVVANRSSLKQRTSLMKKVPSSRRSISHRGSLTALTSIALKEYAKEMQDISASSHQEEAPKPVVARRQPRTPWAARQGRPSRPVRAGIQRTRSRSLTSMKKDKRGGKRPSQIEKETIPKAIDDSDLAETSTGGLARAPRQRSSAARIPRWRRTASKEEPSTTPKGEGDSKSPPAKTSSRGRASKPGALHRTRSKSLTSMKKEPRGGKKTEPSTKDDSGLLRGFGDLPPIDIDPKFVGKRSPIQSKRSGGASSDFDDDDDDERTGFAGKFRNWMGAVQDRFGEGKQQK